MTNYQWRVILALIRMILKMLEKPSMQDEEFDEDELNILREAESMSRYDC